MGVLGEIQSLEFRIRLSRSLNAYAGRVFLFLDLVGKVFYFSCFSSVGKLRTLSGLRMGVMGQGPTLNWSGIQPIMVFEWWSVGSLAFLIKKKKLITMTL